MTGIASWSRRTEPARTIEAARATVVRARVIVDMATTWVAVLSTLLLTTSIGVAQSAGIAAVVAPIVPAMVVAMRGYSRSMGVGRVLEHRQLLRAVILTGALVFVVDLEQAAVPILAGTMVCCLLTQAGRAVVDRREDGLRGRGLLEERVLVVARGDSLYDLFDLIDEQRAAGWRVVACAGDCVAQAATRNLIHTGPPGNLACEIERVQASLVIVSADSLSDESLLSELIDLGRRGIDIHVHTDLRGFDSRRACATPIGHDTVLNLRPPRFLRCQRIAKRTLDIAIATATLVLLSPLLIVTAVAIKLEDGGSVLFSQRRVGRDGVTFLMPKFRSMSVDAEQQLDSLRQSNERDGVLFKMRCDPRVTRVGRIIRALSIDEFPQLVSVIRGQMSLVGPRPALPDEVSTFDHRLGRRHDVRPGVTGLWQVEARDSDSFDSYRRLDIFYVENWSLLLDLTILAHTAPAVVGRGLQSLRHQDDARATVSTDSVAPNLIDAHEVASELMAS